MMNAQTDETLSDGSRAFFAFLNYTRALEKLIEKIDREADLTPEPMPGCECVELRLIIATCYQAALEEVDRLVVSFDDPEAAAQ